MTSLRSLASELGTSDRTLRRAYNQGGLRATRSSPRVLDLPLAERNYLRRAWPLLSTLRAVLRTESNVRFAMLFGSRARGSETQESDVDVLVHLREGNLERLVDLTEKLSDATGLQVDLVRLEGAESDPTLLADWVDEGRVLIDRESRWPELRERLPALLEKGRRTEAERTEAALDGIEQLLSS